MSSNTVIVGWKDVYFCERPEYAFFKLKEEQNGQVKESRPAYLLTVLDRFNSPAAILNPRLTKSARRCIFYRSEISF